MKNEHFFKNTVIIHVEGKKEKIMDKLSSLIKEARPLYKQREKRKTIAKMLMVLTMPVIMCTSVYQVYLQGNDVYLSLENNTLQNELLDDDFELLGLNN